MIQRKTLSTVALVVAIALIIAGCGVAGVSQAPEFTPTPTKTPKPTFTPTPEATATPAPTDTPEATPTPVPTDTPEVTNTPEATDTPEATNTPAVAPTNTPAPQPTNPPPPPPTNTPAPPPPTATPSDPYSGQVTQTFTNCAITQVIGEVVDRNGNPKPGVTIRGWWSGMQGDPLTTVAGDYIRPETSESGWDFFLDQGPKAMTFFAEVYRAEDGATLSNTVQVQFPGTCDEGDGNVQKIVFREN